MFNSIKAKIIFNITIFGVLAIIATYTVVYFITSKNTYNDNIDILKTELQIISLSNHSSVEEKMSHLIKSDQNIKYIQLINNNKTQLLKGKSINENELFNYNLKIDNNNVVICYSSLSKDKYIKALMYRMFIVAIVFTFLVIFISIIVSKYLVPASEIIKFFDSISANKPKPLEYKTKNVSSEFKSIKDSINNMISRILQYSSEIQKLAYTDDLTGLKNRSSFNFVLNKRIANNEKFSIMFLDVDNFKLINDAFGHSVGDLVLKEIGSKLITMEKFEVFRLGGDEFIIMFESVIESELLYIASTVIDVISDILVPSIKRHIPVTCSIGISTFDLHTDNRDNLIKYADIAMYEAKKMGKNQAKVFDKSMIEKIEADLLMDIEMKEAAMREEFVLVFQPQYNIQSNRMISAESLVRWKHPTKGLLAPYHFIDFLENSNYIIPVGFQIIKQSCKFIVDMKKNNFDIEMVSINITLKQLIEPMFILNFKRILRETNCDPRWLEFEITERTIMSHLREAIDVIHIIRSFGVKIAIDDFGTGESSLSLIHELPIDKLKIDKSFIDKIKDQGFLTLTIIDIAKNIGATVIAEGVEDQYQADFLKANGCYEIQGYLYSKPISIEELKALCPQSEYILI